MDSTPVSLLERLRQPGAGPAWDRFVRLYAPLLDLWTRRLGLDAHDAADLVQDVFAALVERLPEFVYDPARRFRGWLWALTLNKFRERRRRAVAAAAADRSSGVPTELPDGVAELAEEEYRRHLTGRALAAHAGRLRADHLAGVWAFTVDDRPAADVAAELGLTVGAVYAAKARVLGRLREELRGLLD